MKDHRRTSNFLSYETFEIILSKIPKYVQIGFSGMAEPWANPQCTDMLKLTLEKGFNVRIFTTLYGINESEGKTIVDLLRKHRHQIDKLVIHLPDAKGNMVGWNPSREWLSVFVKFVDLFNSQVLPSFGMMTMDSSGSLHPALNMFNIKISPGWTGNARAGSLDESQVQGQKLIRVKHETPVSCSVTPFYDLGVVLPNGDVALCCMDYGLKHIIGNLLDMDYYDLFQSDEMNKLRTANMSPEPQKCSICKACERAIPYKVDKAHWVALPNRSTQTAIATTD